MDSVTKTKLSNEQIAEMTKRAFGNETVPDRTKELTDGFFNTAYLVKLHGGGKAVLKVSPAKDVRTMRYEKNIMDTEVQVLNAVAAETNVPVPKVLYHDKSHVIVDCDFFFMEFLNGVPLNKLHGKLSESQFQKIFGEAGSFAKQISGIKSGYFGSLAQSGKRFGSWDEAFCRMVKDLLEDASDIGLSLPSGQQKIYDTVCGYREVLGKVKTPALIHKDLWEGNLFVDPEAAAVTGIIDFERAVCGDALLEPVCGFLLGNETFMAHYLGKTVLSREEKIRAVLYQIYLFLIMVIECGYRKYSGDENEKWARRQLDAALRELESF